MGHMGEQNYLALSLERRLVLQQVYDISPWRLVSVINQVAVNRNRKTPRSTMKLLCILDVPRTTEMFSTFTVN